MVNTYRLINPHIKGEFKTSLKSKNSIEAGKKFYKNLSEHFNNNIPEFYFTIQKLKERNLCKHAYMIWNTEYSI